MDPSLTEACEALRSAKFIETRLPNGDLFIQFAHLSGKVYFCDGEMYWSCLGFGVGGSARVDQTNIDASARELEAYGRACVMDNLSRIAEKAIARMSKQS